MNMKRAKKKLFRLGSRKGKKKCRIVTPSKVLCRTPSGGQTYEVWQFLKENREENIQQVDLKK